MCFIAEIGSIAGGKMRVAGCELRVAGSNRLNLGLSLVLQPLSHNRKN